MIVRLSTIHKVFGLGAGLLVAACGGDSSGDSSASDSQGASTGVTSGSPTTGSTPTTGGTTEETASASEAQSSTDEPGTSTSTSGSTGGSTDAGTSTGMVDPGTTTGDGTTGTTGAVSTTGDTDTDGGGSTGNDQVCPLAVMHLPCDAMSDDALHALGLNCSSLGGKWIDKSTATAIAKLDFQAPPPANGLRSWQVAKSYGTFIDPMTKKPF